MGATTWDDQASGATTDTTQTTVTDYSNNVYRKFKVTGHVTNEFNTEFAKLDVFPSAEANSQPVKTGDGSTAIELEDLPDYNLKITSNNGTVRSYENTNTVVTVNEVQVLYVGDGAATQTDGVFKLSYKGEMSQDMDYESSAAQIAEEINGFSALSGPVTVAAERTKGRWTITFDAADGDVAQLETHASSGTATVVTRANGWSIEGPISENLDTMQAGGTINITAAEECTFKVSDFTGAALYFCYDGVCGAQTTDGTDDANAQAAINSILDDNGAAILTGHTTTRTADGTNDNIKVILPIGKSCDGLEMRAKTKGSITEIEKDVNKHNNGKMFKITRSFIQIDATDALTSNTGDSETGTTLAAGVGFSALTKATTLVVNQPSGTCNLKTATDYAFPFYRTVVATQTGNTAALTWPTLLAPAGGATHDTTNCAYSLRRYVITLDSMPTASTTGTHTLLYKSPVGSCNVAETTKG